jgi:hypothetical protein
MQAYADQEVERRRPTDEDFKTKFGEPNQWRSSYSAFNWARNFVRPEKAEEKKDEHPSPSGMKGVFYYDFNDMWWFGKDGKDRFKNPTKHHPTFHEPAKERPAQRYLVATTIKSSDIGRYTELDIIETNNPDEIEGLMYDKYVDKSNLGINVSYVQL